MTSKIVVFALLCASCVFAKPAGQKDLKFPYNYLIFTQEWPVTVCASWIHSGASHKCAYPDNKELFTVHGIWGYDSSCSDPAWDPDTLEPILPDLEQQWTNIHADTDSMSFWEHEWTKHGTCVVQLGIANMTTELDYFKKALEWNTKYNVYDMLKAANIVPNNEVSYTLTEVQAAIQKALGAYTQIQCTSSTLLEIRICFDEDMSVTDCNGDSNCPEKLYYDSEPYVSGRV